MASQGRGNVVLGLKGIWIVIIEYANKYMGHWKYGPPVNYNFIDRYSRIITLHGKSEILSNGVKSYITEQNPERKEKMVQYFTPVSLVLSQGCVFITFRTKIDCLQMRAYCERMFILFNHGFCSAFGSSPLPT